MNGFRKIFSIYSVIGLMLFGFAAQFANAQGARSERESRRVVQSLNAKIEDFRYNSANESSRASASNQNTEDLEDSLQTLQEKIAEFQSKLDRRRENAADVSTVLYAAKDADDAVNRSRLSNKTRGDWTTIRALFDRLATNYNVNWRWDGNGNSDYRGASGNNQYPDDNRFPDDNRYPNDNRLPNNYPPPTGSFNYTLTGTYRLDTSRSENTDEIADRAIEKSGARNNAETRRDLQKKLDAPEQIAVAVRGSQVSLASSRAAAITFAADGRDRTEQTADGRTLRVRTTLRGQELTVSSLGGDTDYTVVFTAIDNGRAMRVTRRITTDYLNQTVFVESIYLKTDSVARLDISSDSNNSNDSNDVGGSYSSSDSSDSGGNYPNNSGSSNNYPNNDPAPANGRTGDFVVPNGTIVTGNLQNAISTKASQNNDRFRMTITAPNEFRGAVVEGRVSGLSRSGNSQITFNFETIRLPNNRTYDFTGFLQRVTDAEGGNVKIDAEGAARGNSRTRETIKRGGIGAGIGAIIGAIAGGGQGAAIGAIIGGGAGAGSVIIQGKGDLELEPGSSITVQSSSPIR
ncbi:MAG: hypothetical protein M3525_00540 [Acidobacteriota bacterium]|nr:hypothetical protein [Acidobacteriota bacterium]